MIDGTARIPAIVFQLSFFILHAAREVNSIWGKLKIMVNERRTWQSPSHGPRRRSGVLIMPSNKEAWIVVNKNHRLYGLASTQYIQTTGNDNVIATAKRPNRFE